MAARLGIHVLGPRYGESVILELPDGGVGVIDSFAAAAGPHPVVAFLDRTFPSLRELRFFALTHPHADHCLRAAEVIDRAVPSEVWVFHPFPAGQVQNYYTALALRGTRDRVEAALDLPVGTVSESLLQFYRRVRRPIIQGTLPFRPFKGGQASARFCGKLIRINYLTPVALAQFAYADEVERANRRMLDDGPTLRAAGDISQPDHNRASGAILVEYGQTRALLMADAEGARWQEWLTTGPEPALCRPVHFLKVSHHGSHNGYHAPLFAALADPAQTLAVVTPFNHGSVALPSTAGVHAIRPHVSDLYCTNRDLAQASTGLSWLPRTPPAALSPPARWVSMIARQPLLATLLVPEAGGTATAAPPPPVPRTWVIDAQRAPELWRVLLPAVRPATASGPAAVDHIVSAYYDNRGNLTDLQVGSGAGRLGP